MRQWSITNKDGLFREVKVRGSLGYSDCEMVEFKILSERSEEKVGLLPCTSGEII